MNSASGHTTYTLDYAFRGVARYMRKPRMKYNLFNIPYEEKAAIGLESHVYGHPTDGGMKQLATLIDSIKCEHSLEFINGIDLGCGDGKLVDYFNKNIENSEWHGIELSESRIQCSDYVNSNNIMHGDLLHIDYTDYNFLYINNVCFEDDLCERIEYKIRNEFGGYAIFSKKIQTPALYKHAICLATPQISMNWSKTHIIYVYKFD